MKIKEPNEPCEYNCGKMHFPSDCDNCHALHTANATDGDRCCRCGGYTTPICASCKTGSVWEHGEVCVLCKPKFFRAIK